MGRKRIKINLLTFNSALSYGAVLQTYALVKAVEKLNCEVEIIDFRAPFLPPVPTGLWSLRTNFNISRLKKELLFLKFRNKHLANKTKSIYSVKSLKKQNLNADLYVVGSDQVWNPDITKKYAKTYFLDFIRGNKISYAASFGKNEWNYPSTFTDEIRNILIDFKAISVREAQGIEILNEKFGLDGVTVLDPTLLNPDFTSILSQYSRKDQLSAVSVNSDPNFIAYVSKIQRILNIPAFIIDSKTGAENITPVPFPQVKDWIRYIAESSFIVTDSFHGVALSIIYHKDFVVVNANPKRFVRIQDLLTKLGLLDRIVDPKNDINEEVGRLKSINYHDVDLQLEKHREFSLNFLKSSIKPK